MNSIHKKLQYWAVRKLKSVLRNNGIKFSTPPSNKTLYEAWCSYAGIISKGITRKGINKELISFAAGIEETPETMARTLPPKEYNRNQVEKLASFENGITRPYTRPKTRRLAPAISCDPRSSEFLETREWRVLRYRVLERHGAACQCCGRSRKDGVVIHVDHIKPRHTHPHLALVESNLQVLCEDCNIGKGAWDNTDWR